jgi:thiamine monophosphate synthase
MLVLPPLVEVTIHLVGQRNIKPAARPRRLVNDLPSRLLVVTDRKLAARSILETVRAAIDGGATWIWLRDRDLPANEREELAQQLIVMITGRACLTIGGDVELARSCGAQGVHLPAGSDLQIAGASRRAIPDRRLGA